MRLYIAIVIFVFINQAFAGQPFPVAQPSFAVLGDATTGPFGWTGFCADNPGECAGGTREPHDVVLTASAWSDLDKVNRWVNHHVRPMSDIDHWGVFEKWSLPTDGYGDCEDYVLLKRKMLVDAGWPREALLITEVRDTAGEAHVVLTVKSDKGEFILDNQSENIVTSSDTGYRFLKRQSQTDAMVWLSVEQAPALSKLQATSSISDSRRTHR